MLASLLAKLNDLTVGPSENLELEIRLLLDSRVPRPKFVRGTKTPAELIEACKALIKKFPNSERTLSETINSMTHKSDTTTTIMQRTFINGVYNPDLARTYEKQAVGQIFLVDDQASYKFAASIERDIVAGTKPPAFDLRRGKLRYSILPSAEDCSLYHEELMNWRIDITLTKTILGSGGDPLVIVAVRDALFPKDLTVDNFIDSANWASADAIEVELERMTATSADEKVPPITEASLLVADTIISLMAADSDATETGHLAGKVLRELASVMIAGARKPGRLTIKHISPQVRELTRNLYAQLPIEKYWLTDKADGIRTLLLIKPQEGQIYAASNELAVHKIKKSDIGRTIADTEFVDDKYYIFDVPMYDGKSLMNEPFAVRMEYFDKVINLGGDTQILFKKRFIQPKERPEIKKFYEELPNEVPYDIDGMIFTNEGGYWEPSYKWKPIEKMTIDFLIKLCPKKLLGLSPYTTSADPDKNVLYFLFVGINRNRFNKRRMHLVDYYNDIFPGHEYASADYFPIQFSPADRPYAFLFHGPPELQDKVCELRRQDNEWVYVKLRDDRQKDIDSGLYFGNDYDIAESIWRSYNEPLTLDILAGERSDQYFKETSKAHKSIRHFNRYAIGQTFKKWLLPNIGSDNHKLSIVDLASGKGQDINRYIEMGAKYVLMIEQDKAAVAEMLRRIKSSPNPNIFHVLEADLTKPWQVTMRAIQEGGYALPATIDAVVCNLAIHYFIKSASELDNIISLVDALKPKVFMYTAFDGRTIFDLLKKPKQVDMFEGPTLKYSIKKDYISNTFTGVAQAIDVLLPMSQGEYYKEWLVNADLIQKKMAKLKYKRFEHASFSIYLTNYAEDRPSEYKTLTDIDKEYIALYYFTIFVRS